MGNTKSIFALITISFVAACGGSEFSSLGPDGSNAGTSGSGSGSGAGGEAGQDFGGTGGVEDAGSDARPDSGSGGSAGISSGGTESGGEGGTGSTGSGGSGSGGTGGNGSGGTGGNTCVPQQCANDGSTCGEMPDGCGGISKCIHKCDAPQTCQADHKCGCTEWTSSELAQMCAGTLNLDGSTPSGGSTTPKCGVPTKCQPEILTSCESQPTSCTLETPYDYCDNSREYTTSPPRTFECTNFTRTSEFDQCTYNSGKPFQYSGDPINTDGIQNNEETDVDCGGTKSPIKCKVGKQCLRNADCELQVCTGQNPPNTYGTCSNTSNRKIGCEKTSNGICCQKSKDGWYPAPSETSISCQAGKICLSSADCLGGAPCQLGFCLAFPFTHDEQQTQGPIPSCVNVGAAWCCSSDQFL